MQKKKSTPKKLGYQKSICNLGLFFCVALETTTRNLLTEPFKKKMMKLSKRSKQILTYTAVVGVAVTVFFLVKYMMKKDTLECTKSESSDDCVLCKGSGCCLCTLSCESGDKCSCTCGCMSGKCICEGNEEAPVDLPVIEDEDAYDMPDLVDDMEGGDEGKLYKDMYEGQDVVLKGKPVYGSSKLPVTSADHDDHDGDGDTNEPYQGSPLSCIYPGVKFQRKPGTKYYA